MNDESLWFCWAAAASGLDVGAVDWQALERGIESAQAPLPLDWAKIEAAAGLQFNAECREHIDRGLKVCIQYNDNDNPTEATERRFLRAADKAIADLRSAMSTPLGRAMFPEAAERFEALESFANDTKALFASKLVRAAMKGTIGTTESTRGLPWAARRFSEAYLASGGGAPLFWAKGTEAGGRMLLGLHEALRQAIAYPHQPYTLARWLDRNLPPIE